MIHIFHFKSSHKHCDSIAGSSEQHADTLQVPRHVRLVRAEDLLEGHAGLPDSRQDLERTFPERRVGDAEQSGKRDTVGQNSRIASEAAGSAEAEEASRPQEEAPGSRETALLLSEIAQLLRTGLDDRHRGHHRSQVQQDQHRRWRMRQFVLRQRLQRGTTATNGAVSLQISLVLHGKVSKLHGGGMDHGLQIRRIEEKAKVKDWYGFSSSLRRRSIKNMMIIRLARFER